MKPACIVGLDPGLAYFGWGAIAPQPKGLANASLQMLGCGEIHSQSSQPLALRLEHIYRELTQVFDRYQPAACAIEEVYLNQNRSSALPVAHARGVALLCAAQHQAEVQEFSANRIKLAVTGYGKAQKQQVQEMVAFLLGLQNRLAGGKERQKPLLASNHAADALAAAICLVHQYEAHTGSSLAIQK